MQRSIAATSAIFSILDSPPTVQDVPNAVALSSSRGRIDFENVTFRYANTATDALSNLTLHFEPGKTHALVGASGAGKSTILSLILRDRKSTRLNSSHGYISYAVFCLKNKKAHARTTLSI